MENILKSLDHFSDYELKNHLNKFIKAKDRTVVDELYCNLLKKECWDRRIILEEVN